ncbi:MAG: peptide deformylase [Anaerolinea sp.]|nr:peptide deformylase [Anaerolinea sp.]
MFSKLSIVTTTPVYAHLSATSLRKKSKPIDIESFDSDLLKKIILDMYNLLYEAGGVGIAAPQVGLNLQIVAIDESRGKEVEPLVLINPKITYYGSELVEDREGCLSLPGYAGLVERSKQIKVSYWNQHLESVEMPAEDYLARVIQHEVDHLRGVLYIDHIKYPDKLMAVDQVTLSQEAMAKLYNTTAM